MENTTKPRSYDLEDRTFLFTKAVLKFSNAIPKSIANNEVAKQLVRSAGSIGANYIEANEAFSKKDFAMRVKICRKEAKETVYWLKLLQTDNNDIEKHRESLVQEASELMKIFGAIVEKTKV
ncbi:MAG: four helix bundle protein [Dehalococcoidales bacterium]|nr:four helix bundle protein [Dehalococcoidales bacterium]